jgi:5-methylcytosine-specific restriction endonuclease McrA
VVSRKDNEDQAELDPKERRREYLRLYNQRNRERIRERERERYRQDSQRAMERIRRYQATEKGKATAQRARSKDNPVYLARMQRYRDKANENNRRWYRNNLSDARAGKVVAQKRRLDRLKRNGGTYTREQIQDRVAFWGFRCWVCRGPWDTMDHVKPVVAGGPSWPSNLRPICKTCNQRKGKTWPYSV